MYWIALDPTKGHEQQKTRPCVVLSVNVLHDRMGMAVVVPLTSSLNFRNPGTRLIIEGAHIQSLPGEALENGKNVALCHQVRAVDIKGRFVRKHGDMTRAGLAEVEAGVAWILGMLP